MYSNYRMPGEFEPQKAVWATWIPIPPMAVGYDPKPACAQVVKELHERVQVYINCVDAASKDDCVQYLTDAGVDLDKIIFTSFPDINFYLRDNGPNVMFDPDGRMLEVNTDFDYYSMMPNGDPMTQLCRQAGVHMAVSMGCYDIVSTDIVTEGGNKEFNGDGVLILIEKTELKRNPGKSRGEIEEAYKRIFNLEKVIWLPEPLFEDENMMTGPCDIIDGVPVYGASVAGHTDEMCRFVDKNTLLLAEISDEEAAQLNSAHISKARLDAAYEILKNETDAHGEPFTIIRMPVPVPMEYECASDHSTVNTLRMSLDETGRFPDGSTLPPMDVYRFTAAVGYCNFLVSNGVVLGQRYWKPGLDEKIKEKDERAKAILEQCFPDRKVVMIDALALNVCGAVCTAGRKTYKLT